MSLRALKGRGNLISNKRLRLPWRCAPRDGTGIIAFVLDYKKGMSLTLDSGYVEILRIAAYILKDLCLLLYPVKHLTEVTGIIDLRNI